MTDQDTFIQALENAIAPLYYPSETDSPWAVVTWAGQTLDRDTLRQWLAVEPTTPLEERAADPFFQRLTCDRPDVVPCAWHGVNAATLIQQYQALRQLLQLHLSNLSVYRVGSTVISIYVMGQFNSDTWIGLTTQAVET